MTHRLLPVLLAFSAFSLAAASPSPAPAAVSVHVSPTSIAGGTSGDTVEIGPPPPDWQQEVSYAMEAALDEEEQVLRGAQVVRYRNASPDTLRSLYFHLYLNAFRPHSVWARNEGRERLDFGALEDPDYGFERLQSVRLLEGPGAGGAEAPGSGLSLEPAYPHAPDSTVVRLDLPVPLAPGARATLHLRWDARPATLCRRQCREGRSWDLAQWYPRVAVYDGGGWQAHPLYPQGEFYGEFATYDVTLDLAEDQVVGATGVPVEGDPGWDPAPGSPVSEPLYQRDHYGPPSELEAPGDPGLLDDEPADGRKRVRFRAERVHHFGWSTSPEYRYEADVFERGALPDVAVHVLYRPGDDDWDDGVAAERTIRALSWLETLFRPYPYPQITNLHRLEGGGTEFPMLIMDGSASEGLIVHEVTHQYAHGILANNEWKEAWLDEGVTSFIDGWYAEEHGRPDLWDGLMERVGPSEPAPMAIAHPSEDFPNYPVYGYLSYTKPQAVLYMLRELLGKETMRQILKTYYDRYAFRHVNEAAFREVASEVARRDLDWFFDQWLHTTATLDWSVEGGRTVRAPGDEGDGGWRTEVTLRREGEAWMPVTLRLRGDRGSTDVRVESRDRRVTVEVSTPWEPSSVELDPERATLDVDRSNDRVEVGTGGSTG